MQRIDRIIRQNRTKLVFVLIYSTFTLKTVDNEFETTYFPHDRLSVCRRSGAGAVDILLCQHVAPRRRAPRRDPAGIRQEHPGSRRAERVETAGRNRIRRNHPGRKPGRKGDCIAPAKGHARNPGPGAQGDRRAQRLVAAQHHLYHRLLKLDCRQQREEPALQLCLLLLDRPHHRLAAGVGHPAQCQRPGAGDRHAGRIAQQPRRLGLPEAAAGANRQFRRTGALHHTQRGPGQISALRPQGPQPRLQVRQPVGRDCLLRLHRRAYGRCQAACRYPVEGQCHHRHHHRVQPHPLLPQRHSAHLVQRGVSIAIPRQDRAHRPPPAQYLLQGSGRLAAPSEAAQLRERRLGHSRAVAPQRQPAILD